MRQNANALRRYYNLKDEMLLSGVMKTVKTVAGFEALCKTMLEPAFDFGGFEAAVDFLAVAVALGDTFPDSRVRIAHLAKSVLYEASDEQFAMTLELNRRKPIDDRSTRDFQWHELSLFFEEIQLFESLYDNKPESKHEYLQSAWLNFAFIVDGLETPHSKLYPDYALGINKDELKALPTAFMQRCEAIISGEEKIDSLATVQQFLLFVLKVGQPDEARTIRSPLTIIAEKTLYKSTFRNTLRRMHTQYGHQLPDPNSAVWKWNSIELIIEDLGMFNDLYDGDPKYNHYSDYSWAEFKLYVEDLTY